MLKPNKSKHHLPIRTIVVVHVKVRRIEVQVPSIVQVLLINRTTPNVTVRTNIVDITIVNVTKRRNKN